MKNKFIRNFFRGLGFLFIIFLLSPFLLFVYGYLLFITFCIWLFNDDTFKQTFKVVKEAH